MKKETNKKSHGCRGITDEQVEREIERLKESEYVALARYENRLKYAHRQHLYQCQLLGWIYRRLEGRKARYCIGGGKKEWQMTS